MINMGINLDIFNSKMINFGRQAMKSNFPCGDRYSRKATLTDTTGTASFNKLEKEILVRVNKHKAHYQSLNPAPVHAPVGGPPGLLILQPWQPWLEAHFFCGGTFAWCNTRFGCESSRYVDYTFLCQMCPL